MPEAILQQKIYPYDGSLDATKHPLLISPKDVVSAENIIYTHYSTKKNRPGITEIFPGVFPYVGKILSGIDFWRLGVQRVVIYNGFQILAFNPNSNTFENISLNFNVPVDDVVHFKTFAGLLIITFSDPNTPIKAWVGTGQLLDLSDFGVGVPPNAPFCEIWLNKLWLPDPSIPGRLLHSATGTVNFVGGNAGAEDLDVNDNDPEGLSSIFPPYFGSLYVTKFFSVYQLKPVILGDGTLIFSQSKISDGVGCVSHGSVAAAPQNLFFASHEAIHYFQTSDRISAIEIDGFSDQIAPLWTGETNFKRMKYARAIYEKNLKSYILLYPSESNNFPDSAWGFSLIAKKWYHWNDYNQTCLFSYTNPLTKKLNTIVGSSDGRLGVIDETVSTDYGKPVPISIRSGITAPGGAPDDQFIYNQIIPIFVPQESGKFEITYKIDGRVIETLEFEMSDDSLSDFLGIDFILGQSVLGGIPQLLVDKRNIIGNGMFYELLITYSGEGSGFELLGILMNVDRVAPRLGRTVA